MAQNPLMKDVERLYLDEDMIIPTRKAAAITEETGNEAEFRYMERLDGGRYCIGPDGHDKERACSRGLFAQILDGEKLVLHEHTHPSGCYAPSGADIDIAERYSRLKEPPVFAIAVNGIDGKIEVIAYRRKRPSTSLEQYAAFFRNIATIVCKDVLGMDTEGPVHPKYRKFERECLRGLREWREGKKDYTDVFPDALNSTGLYEAVAFAIEKGKRE